MNFLLARGGGGIVSFYVTSVDKLVSSLISQVLYVLYSSGYTVKNKVNAPIKANTPIKANAPGR